MFLEECVCNLEFQFIDNSQLLCNVINTRTSNCIYCSTMRDNDCFAQQFASNRAARFKVANMNVNRCGCNTYICKIERNVESV